jgi:hypothetical protein
MTLTDIEKPLTAAGKRSKLLALTCFPLPASPDQLKGSDYLNFNFPKQILYHLYPIIAKIRTPISHFFKGLNLLKSKIVISFPMVSF